MATSGDKNGFYMFKGLQEKREEYTIDAICGSQTQNIYSPTLYRKMILLLYNNNHTKTAIKDIKSDEISGIHSLLGIHNLPIEGKFRYFI